MTRWKGKKNLPRLGREGWLAFQNQHRGEFFTVPLDGEYGFGRYLGSITFAFYDLKSPKILPLEEIERQPVLFVIGSGIDAMFSGHWKVIGQKPLPPELQAPIKFFHHPRGTDYVGIYLDGEFYPYAGEDLTKMESVNSCDHPLVEERLRSHFAGRPDLNAQRYSVPRELAERLRREYFERQAASGEKK